MECEQFQFKILTFFQFLRYKVWTPISYWQLS